MLLKVPNERKLVSTSLGKVRGWSLPLQVVIHPSQGGRVSVRTSFFENWFLFIPQQEVRTRGGTFLQYYQGKGRRGSLKISTVWWQVMAMGWTRSTFNVQRSDLAISIVTWMLSMKLLTTGDWRLAHLIERSWPCRDHHTPKLHTYSFWLCEWMSIEILFTCQLSIG